MHRFHPFCVILQTVTLLVVATALGGCAAPSSAVREQSTPASVASAENSSDTTPDVTGQSSASSGRFLGATKGEYYTRYGPAEEFADPNPETGEYRFRYGGDFHVSVKFDGDSPDSAARKVRFWKGQGYSMRQLTAEEIKGLLLAEFQAPPNREFPGESATWQSELNGRRVSYDGSELTIEYGS